MATLQAIFPPKSKSGGISDSQTFTVNAATNQTVSVGIRQIFALSVSGACFVRLSTGASTAAATDFLIPGASIQEFDTAEEFDTVNVFNNGGSAITISVMRLNRAG